MDSHFNSTVPSAAHPESMDFLSRAWCSFAVQTLQSDQLKDHQLSLALVDSPIREFDSKISVSSMKMDDGVDDKFGPPWKSNDVKSWLWMHQAMHPEVNYNSYFRRKWFQWKVSPLKNVSFKKWWKEIKQRRKEEDRLQRAEVHAAISIAGVAASLAAIAAERTIKEGKTGDAVEIAMASAAALVAAQCAEVAEAMGAKKKELRSVIGSAVSGGACDILTLTAAAATSLKGAAILKARSGCRTIHGGGAPVLPWEDCNNEEIDLNLEKNKSIIGKGHHLPLQTPDGTYKVRSVSIAMNNDGKVILKVKKLNLMREKQESMVMEMHVELYRDGEDDERETTCYLIVLTTSRGLFKLDIGDDYQLYLTWGNTIHQMLTSSSSFSKNYQIYRN